MAEEDDGHYEGQDGEEMELTPSQMEELQRQLEEHGYALGDGEEEYDDEGEYEDGEGEEYGEGEYEGEDPEAEAHYYQQQMLAQQMQLAQQHGHLQDSPGEEYDGIGDNDEMEGDE